MRDVLKNLIHETILFKYDLPNQEIEIDKSIFSTENDKCYASSSNEELAEIIYNAIIEYSFNEFDITGKDYKHLHANALKTKLKYNELSSVDHRIKHGFFGEILLYCILHRFFQAKPAISRGYFYNPLERSETKGYDSYHLINNGKVTELWFGEVKFRKTYSSGIKEAIDNIEKAISDQYLETNFYTISNQKNNFNIAGTKIEFIIKEWEKQACEINLLEEISRHQLKLVYPILIIYDEHGDGYDPSINNAINYINTHFAAKSFNLSIPYSIYFILLPVNKVKNIKTTVIKWIESKKQLMS